MDRDTACKRKSPSPRKQLGKIGITAGKGSIDITVQAVTTAFSKETGYMHCDSVEIVGSQTSQLLVRKRWNLTVLLKQW